MIHLIRYIAFLSSVLIVLLSDSNNSLHAQINGGSNYSILGIGDILQTNSAVYEGLAGTGIAMPSEYAINTENPALWSYASSTRLQVGYRYNQHLTNQNDASLYQNNGEVNGIMGIFSVDTSLGVSFSFGILPYSMVAYYIAVPLEVNFDGTNLTGRSFFSGDGGISRFYLGGSSKITDWLRFGFQTHFNIGNINTTVETEIDDNISYKAKNTRADNFVGVGIKSGITINLLPKLILGAFFENNFATNVNSEVIWDPDFAVDSTISNEFDINLPVTYGVGFAYETGRFMVGADLSVTDFSSFDYLNNANSTFRNTLDFSLGASRIGSKRSGEDYENRITYNFGAGYRQLYYNINNNNIDELYASFGASLPIANSTLFDIALLAGSRGTASDGLVQEYFLRATFNISIGDSWFKPFKRNY